MAKRKIKFKKLAQKPEKKSSRLSIIVLLILIAVALGFAGYSVAKKGGLSGLYRGIAGKVVETAFQASCGDVTLDIPDTGTCFNPLSNELYVRVNRVDLGDAPIEGISFTVSQGVASKTLEKIKGINAEGILVLRESESQGIPKKDKPVDYVLRNLGMKPESVSVSTMEKAGNDYKACENAATKVIATCFMAGR